MATEQQKQRALEILKQAGGQPQGVINIHPSVQSAIDRAKGNQQPQSSEILPEQRFGTQKLSAPEVAAGEAGRTFIRAGQGAASLGERALTGILQTVLPKSAERAIGIEDRPNLGIFGNKTGEGQKTSAEQLIPEELTMRGQTGASQAGRIGAEALLFALPGGAATKAGRAAKGLAASRGAGKLLQGAAGLGGVAATEAGLAGGTRAVLEGDINKEVGTEALLGGALPIGFAGAGKVLKGIGKTGGEILGLTTGAKGGAIKEVFDNPDVINFVRRAGKNIDEIQEETLDLARTGLQTVKQQRGTAYRRQLSQIANITDRLDNVLDSTRNKTKQLLKDIGADINLEQIGRGKGGKLNTVDFSQTSLVEGADVVERAVNTVTGWKDTSPLGLDKLKQRLDDLAGQLKAPGKQKAKRIVTELANEVRQGLRKNVKGYEEMTRGYQQASGLIDELERTLSLSGKRTDQQALTKLSRILRPGQEEGARLARELQEILGEDIVGRIAGTNLAPLAPRGLAGVLAPGAFTGGGIAVIANPSAWPLFLTYAATASPRVVAEMVSLLGRIAQQVEKTGTITPQLQRSFRALIDEIRKENESEGQKQESSELNQSPLANDSNIFRQQRR